MVNPFAGIPLNELPVIILLICILVLVFGGLIYFQRMLHRWNSKVCQKYGIAAMFAGRWDEAHKKSSAHAKETFSKTSKIYSLVGIGLLLIRLYVDSLPLMLFGMSFLIIGIGHLSASSLSEKNLQRYLDFNKKRTMVIMKIYIFALVATFFIWPFVRGVTWISGDSLAMWGYLCLGYAVFILLDHLFIRIRIGV